MIDFKNPQEIAAIIDQTLLQPTATLDQVQSFCEKSATTGFASVCVAPCWVEVAAETIVSSGTRICTVAGFPLGFEPLELKVRAVQTALNHGADEIDYVVNLGAVKGGDYKFVAAEMRAMRQAAEKAIVKIILETGHLRRREIKRLCQLAVDTEIDFVKTSTGLGPTGASVADVAFMSECCRGRIKVKAAGGIRTLQQLQQMITAGAHRIGTSAGEEIVEAAAVGGNLQQN